MTVKSGQSYTFSPNQAGQWQDTNYYLQQALQQISLSLQVIQGNIDDLQVQVDATVVRLTALETP